MIKTTDLCDEYQSKVKICKTDFQVFGKKKDFYGPIATVKVKEDNVLVRQALETEEAGTLIVVDGKSSNNCALLGDQLASIIIERKLAGIIIYGRIRDVADINKMEVGIRALGTMPVKSNKEGKGSRNVKLKFGEVDWIPGEYAYVDEDGIVLSKELLV
ncbi:MAG: ribonuclease E activity regulator RraA [bacterium]